MMRVSRVAPLLVLMLVLAPERAPGDTSTCRALLIGIESYASFGDVWYDLDGPANDIALVAEVLHTKFGFQPEHTTRLLDATRAQIEAAFEQLIDRTRPGDRVYIHYSGHGSRVPDANGDEAAGAYDSTLVPIDARESRRGEILDDEIALWLHRLRQRTPHVVFLVDACHSGTISRAAEPLKTRGAPTVDDRSYAWSKELDLRPLDEKLDPDRDRFVRLSACLDSQRAKEHRTEGGEIFGLFTWTWCQALLEAGSEDTYGTVMRRVAARVFRQRSNLQHPQIEGRDDALLFAGAVRELPRLLAVRSVEGDVIHLQGGLLQGVAVGSTFECLDETATAPVLEITGVEATSCAARMASGPIPEPGDLFRERERAQSLPPFRAVLDPIARELLGAHLSERPAFEIVDTPPADAVLRVVDGKLHVLDERGDPYGAGLLDPEVLTLAVEGGPGPALHALRRCHDLRDILRLTRSHLAFRPEVTIELVELLPAACDDTARTIEIDGRCWVTGRVMPLREHEPSVALPSETVLSFRIRNDSLETLYFYLFNFSPTGETRQFFPREGEESRAEVWSDDSLLITKSAFRLEGSTEGLLDTYVWFVTREPVDLRFLSREASVPSRGGSTRVENLARRFGGRATRGGTTAPLRVGDLATRMISIEVQAAGPR